MNYLANLMNYLANLMNYLANLMNYLANLMMICHPLNYHIPSQYSRQKTP